MSKVVVIGAGNVGYHLIRMFVSNSQQVVQMVSSDVDRVRDMAEPLNIPYTDNFDEIEDADLYVLAVSDSVVSEYLEKLNIPENKLVVHTSGILPITIIPEKYRRGVFYPLQTFTKGRGLAYEKIPIFFEAENASDEKLLKEIVLKVTDLGYSVPLIKRQQMHVAAVFANNFVNHMYYQAERLCNKNDLDFDLLLPLIQETADKIQTISPLEAQTGPAVRNDVVTMEEHEKIIQNSYVRTLYEQVSESINRAYHNEL